MKQNLNIEKNSVTLKSKKIEKSKLENIPFEQEILRKGIHLMSLSIPVIYIFVTKEFALSILIPMMIISFLIDILSKYDNIVRTYLLLYFGKMLRDHEKKRDIFVLNGATWVLISAVVTILIFPKVIAVISFMILIISDISAALIGRRFGKHKLLDKTIEGTFAFIMTGFLVVWIVGTIYQANLWFYLAGYMGAFVGGIVELISKKIKVDDNISIPISVGITMSLVNLFIYWFYDQTFLDLFYHQI